MHNTVLIEWTKFRAELATQVRIFKNRKNTEKVDGFS